MSQAIAQNTNLLTASERPASEMLSQDRIVSVHFPKAGGSSLHYQLCTLLGDDVFLDIDHDPLTPAGAQPGLFPVRKRVLHGHFRAQRYSSVDAYWMTFLRHPVENLISIYFYWKSLPTPGHDLHRRFLIEQPSIIEFASYRGFQRLMSETYFGGFDMRRFNFIGFHETRHLDIPRLAKELNLPLSVSKHINKTPPSAQREDIKTNRSIQERLSDLLREDLVFYDRLRLAPAF